MELYLEVSSMVQKPHRERKFTDCHLTRRKASCSFCVIPPRAFCIFPASLSSLLFINLSSVYWVMTDSNWPAYFHSLWREAIQRLRQHIKVRKKKSDSGKMREKSPWLWFWQLECFKLFSLLKRGSHISVWFMQKIYRHIELLKSFHICNLLNFLWKFHRKLQLLLLLEIKNNEERPFKKFSLFLPDLFYDLDCI